MRFGNIKTQYFFSDVEIHRNWLAAALIGLVFLCGATMGARAEPFAVPTNYKLVWADEFDVSGVPDARKWSYNTDRNKVGWHNHELQYYSAQRAENAVVKDGFLLITARKEKLSAEGDWGGQRYTSARLTTQGRAEWTYGFFEVRAKMPCGKGTWPAIWTLGNKDKWPDSGELDIMEHVGSDPARISSAVHTLAGHGSQVVYGATRITDACSEFHRYQMHWTADAVTFGVDGFAHLNYPRLNVDSRAWPFNRPQYLLLNVAIGGDLGGEVDDGIFPVAMQVDYVRVYQAIKP